MNNQQETKKKYLGFSETIRETCIITGKSSPKKKNFFLTVIELIWTISPAVVLIFIAFPSFKLLFLVDDVPNACITINVTGFILYGLILYIISKIKDASDTREKNNTFQKSYVSSNRLAQVKGTGYFLKKNHIRSFHTSSRANKRIGPHNHEVISVIIGSMLGDGYVNSRTIEGVRFCYRQNDQEYIYFLYNFFHEKGYTRGNSIHAINSIKRKIYGFETYTFRSLNWIDDMFYNKGKKYLSNEVESYLTPLALGIWVVSSGKVGNGQLRLYTCLHDKEDIDRLKDMLVRLYGLEISIFKSNKYGIVISSKSTPIFLSILSPIFTLIGNVDKVKKLKSLYAQTLKKNLRSVNKYI